MAYYFLTPEKDATVYSHPNRVQMNTGHDEILEIVKERGTSDSIFYPSRIFVKFNDDEIKSAIEDAVGNDTFRSTDESTGAFNSCSISLQLSSTEHKTLPSIINLEVYAISESWDEGTGRFSNLPTSSNGCSWVYRDNTLEATIWTTASFSAGSSGSISSSNGNLIEQGGGTWYTGSSFSAEQQFINAQILDTDFNVTKTIHKFSSSYAGAVAEDSFAGISNNGFVVKLPSSIEDNVSSSFGELQYFSADTHTIYPPKLAFKWIDYQEYSLQSSFEKTGELSVTLYNNKEEYNQNEVALFKVKVREKYPTRTFTTTSNYLSRGYFSTSSLYSVRDAHTEEVVIPFDETFTRLSSDSNGMHFKIYMNGLQPERYYRVLFKNINADGTTVYDNNYNFKVIR